ncbi:hypothetical protein DSM3645_25222 [Blastopirellula marina DSM 3645]|uniref:SMI1/KNR4 family protein n=1 Tax=Blastopirellula marina DSM 3645 TaxID=314230 RepID=A4A0B2_9BACT|nr:hypothetical protein DSM3645_25222 [Blastopirellula marina DSM 3645]
MLAAGWRADRNVLNQLDMPKSYLMFPAITQIFAEFGNLKLATARETIWIGVEADPECIEECSEFEAHVDTQLFPIGHCSGCDFIYIVADIEGRIYLLNDELRLYALDIYGAIECLLLDRWRCDNVDGVIEGSVWKIRE